MIDHHPADCSEGCIVKLEERVDRVDPEVAALVGWVGVIPEKWLGSVANILYGNIILGQCNIQTSRFGILKYFSR